MDRRRVHHLRRDLLRRGGNCLVILVCVFLLYVGPGTTSASTLQSVTTIDEVLARISETSSAAVAAAVTDTPTGTEALLVAMLPVAIPVLDCS